MSYRRLPNTDTARIKAMKTALDKGKELPPQKLAFQPKTVMKLERLLPRFESNIHLYRHSLLLQNKYNQTYCEVIRKARLYLTHFIRVMNMAILRGEFPPEIRTYYDIGKDDNLIPALNTENELVSWGRRIIEGEEFRVRKGGNPVTNPSIALVKVRFESFLEALTYHNILEKKTLDHIEKNVELRKETDELILQIWNEIENSHKMLPEEDRKLRNEEYGIKYFLRKSEQVSDAGF